MALTQRHIRVAGFLLGEELARRRRTGAPIPALMTETHRALTTELDACAYEPCGATTASLTIENVKTRSRRLKVSESTVRRNAIQTGAQKIGRDWFWILDL
jgi:hypothetical protein